MWYWVKTNRLIKNLFPKYIWDQKSIHEKTVYLTFDDGPAPEITLWVLEQLRKYNARATFFCIGDNISKHPEIFQSVIAENHSVGNHTFNHINGWKTKTEAYLDNTILCQDKIEEFLPENKRLFRPPYGKIKNSQAKKLIAMGYKIIMWDILSADFDQSISQEKCLSNVLNNIEPGSIIIFHDSIKAEKNLRFVLPKILTYLQDNDYRCKSF